MNHRTKSLKERSEYRQRALENTLTQKTGEKCEIISNKNILAMLKSWNGYDFTDKNERIGYDFASEISLLVVNGLVGKIPVVGSILTTMISSFWPSGSKSLWDEIKDQVQQLINESIDKSTWNILSAKLSELREKVIVWQRYIDEQNWEASVSLYNFISNYLIGMEENFKIKGASVDQAFTPLFVSMVDFSLSFRINVVLNYDELHLTKKHADNETMLIKRLINGQSGAANYITIEFNKYHERFMRDAEKFKLDARPPKDFDNASIEYGFLVGNGLTVSRAKIWEERANNLAKKSYIDLDVIIPAQVLGDFSGKFKNGSEIYSKMFGFTKDKGFDYIKSIKISTRKQRFRYSKREVTRECLVKSEISYFSGIKVSSPTPQPGPTHNYTLSMLKSEQIYHTYFGLIYNSRAVYPCHISNLTGYEIKTEFPEYLVPGEQGAFVRMRTNGFYILRAIDASYSNSHGYITNIICCFGYNNEKAKYMDINSIKDFARMIYSD